MGASASGDRFDKASIEATAARVRSTLEGRGVTVNRVDVPEPGKHPHADIMGALLLAISSFGLLVLAFAGILVMNLDGWLVGQVEIHRQGANQVFGSLAGSELSAGSGPERFVEHSNLLDQLAAEEHRPFDGAFPDVPASDAAGTFGPSRCRGGATAQPIPFGMHGEERCNLFQQPSRRPRLPRQRNKQI